MAKKKQDDMPPDVWLMVATDALARYATNGGKVMVATDGSGNLTITLDAGIDDPRLADSFIAMVTTLEPA